MFTALGWKVLNLDAGFSVTHAPCGDSMELNLATVAALQGLGTDIYVEPYREFLEFHNTWKCREKDHDLESILSVKQDADPEIPSSN